MAMPTALTWKTIIEEKAMTELPASEDPGMIPTHPGELLREDVLPALGLSVTQAARELGLSRQMLHDILAERRAISPSTALRLGKFCGNGPDLWLRMQMNHDLWCARKELGTALNKIPTHQAA